MNVETFQRIAIETLKEVTKDKKERYGWIHWNPAQDWDSNTVITILSVTLWEGSPDYLIQTMHVPYDLSENAMWNAIKKWLSENLP